MNFLCRTEAGSLVHIYWTEAAQKDAGTNSLRLCSAFFFLTWFTDVKRDKGKRLTCKIKHTLGKSFRLNVELILNYLTCK